MSPQEMLKWYEEFFQKVIVWRQHHYDKKNLISGAYKKEYKVGLEIDNMIINENRRRKKAKVAAAQQVTLFQENKSVEQS